MTSVWGPFFYDCVECTIPFEYVILYRERDRDRLLAFMPLTLTLHTYSRTDCGNLNVNYHMCLSRFWSNIRRQQKKRNEQIEKQTNNQRNIAYHIQIDERDRLNSEEKHHAYNQHTNTHHTRTFRQLRCHTIYEK